MVHWIPDDATEEAAMLSELGLKDAAELFADIPPKARVRRLGLGRGLEERELVAEVDRSLERNRPQRQFASFLGGRIASRYLPAAVDAILSRSEFSTSYTPYQPEASQGTLEALFEFQSLWVEMTGLDVANASLYDGATAAGEALLLARRIHEGRRFLVPASLPWEERSVLSNYASGPGLSVVEIPYDERTGGLDLSALGREISHGDVFGVLADVPNGFGHIDDALLELRATVGEIPLVVVADPLSLSVLPPPGDYGADIVVGEGQSFGMPPSFGGPLLGLLACRKEHVRWAPGRIVGATCDSAGRPAYTLTLQTREQHIRRSRATSNICTNQSLLAIAFVAYASLLGPEGLARLQRNLSERAHQLAASLQEIPGLRVPRFSSPFLGDFTVELDGPATTDFLEEMRRRGVLAGQALADPRPGAAAGPARLLVSAQETTDDRAIGRYASAARAVLGAGARR